MMAQRPSPSVTWRPGHTLRRWLAYAWASPTTALGLLGAFATFASGGRLAIVDGVLEAHGGITLRLLERIALVHGGVAALALGHVVLGRDTPALARTRRHERIHVRQCERWGPFFVPAYLLAGGFAWLRGGHAYRDNWFEQQARQSEDEAVHQTT